MNELISGNVVTMSSREIAELTGKDHVDVLWDIQAMFEGLGIRESRFAASYISSQNKELPCYNLSKRGTLILVSGYPIGLRARIIDRWQELEDANKEPLTPMRYPSPA